MTIYDHLSVDGIKGVTAITHLFASLNCICCLKGVKLNGTLLFCAVSDEEHSSIDGVK